MQNRMEWYGMAQYAIGAQSQRDTVIVIREIGKIIEEYAIKLLPFFKLCNLNCIVSTNCVFPPCLS